MMHETKIAVLGAGSFGTTVAHVFAEAGRHVMLWGRDQAVVHEINQKQHNKGYLSFKGRLRICATTELSEALHDADIVVFAIPSQALRGFLQKEAQFLPRQAILANLAKGVELGTFFRPSQIFADVLGQQVLRRYVMISGPTFAEEMCLKMPTAAVVAGNKNVALIVQQALSTGWFRLYCSTDVVGVELGGALKNIMAIAVGIADGLGFGSNTRAGLMTRCLAEMMRIGKNLGAREKTFSGLSGIGDLILTCTGDLSRNRQIGLKLGRGVPVKKILSDMRHVAEGVTTARAAHELCRKLEIDAPNTEHIYKIIYKKLSPKRAAELLLGRELKFE